MTKEISEEIDALLRFYKGRKLISVDDIRVFSKTWVTIQERMKDKMVYSNDKTK